MVEDETPEAPELVDATEEGLSKRRLHYIFFYDFVNSAF